MKPRARRLLNTARIEAVPAWLARARGSATARADIGIGAARDAIARGNSGTADLDDLAMRQASLAIPADYGDAHVLARAPEPPELTLAGRDRYRHPLWLLAPAARGWTRMRARALREGVVLDAISGYRGHACQRGIFTRTPARGLNIEQILAVNAAPGYSPHHSRRDLDIGTPGEPPAEESVESTAAFAVLTRHAGAFGFDMSDPCDNSHGIIH